MTKYIVTIDFVGTHVMEITADNKDDAETLGRDELEKMLREFYTASTGQYVVEEA